MAARPVPITQAACGREAIARPDRTTGLSEFIPHHSEDLPTFGQSYRCSSGNLGRLAAKLCKVMHACAVVPKDKQNPQQHYKYASSDAILEKVNPALVEAGLATVCQVEILDRRDRTTSTGAIWELVTVRVRLTIVDSETGEFMESEGIGQGYDSSDKAFSKAQTQAKKYAWMLALNISTGEDPEADDRSDKAQVPPIPCRKCKSPAAYIDDGEFEGKPVRRYYCEKAPRGEEAPQP